MSEHGLTLVTTFDANTASELSRVGSLSELAQPIRSVPGDLLAIELDEMFRLDEGLRWVVLPEGPSPVLVQRSNFEVMMAGRLGYGRVLHSRRRVAELSHPPTLVLPEETTVAAAARMVIDDRNGEQARRQRAATQGSLAGGATGIREGVLVTGTSGAVRVVGVSEVFERLALHFAYQSMHDPMTGLPNRLYLMQRLADLARSGEPATLLYVDLDRFKDVNDQHGHAGGDQVLIAFGERLRSVSRAHDVVARLGGDEFAVLSSGSMTAAQSRARAERVVLAAAAPFVVAGVDSEGAVSETEVLIGASVGVAHSDRSVADTHVTSLEVLLKQADLAMFRAKRHGRGRVEHFDEELVPTVADADERKRRRHMERRLRAAIEQGLLTLQYQPVVTLPDGARVSVEALVRWQDAELGQVPPDQFIPLAERTGLIMDLGRWVLNEACAQTARWQSEGSTLTVSVNISAIEIAQVGIVQQVSDALASSGLPAQRLCLEVTETAAIEDVAETAHRLRQLASLGVRIALDDFGTGHSSLTMLRDLPIDIVKIDRSFINRIVSNTRDSVLVRLVIDTAHSLGMTVCAEGIEDADQAHQLAALGCDTAQGWYFGLPGAPTSQLTEAVRADPVSAPTRQR